MSKSWKAAESRVGAWLGAKGIGKSGRLPLSGGNSGRSRSDHPHPTIFNECKRDKSYHTAIKYWCELQQASGKDSTVVLVFDNSVICFHSDDVEKILAGGEKILFLDWPKKTQPKIYKLYQATVVVKETSQFDKDKKVVSCTFIYHGHKGFWVVLKRDDLSLWWGCILEARKDRERLLLEESSGRPEPSSN